MQFFEGPRFLCSRMQKQRVLVPCGRTYSGRLRIIHSAPEVPSASPPLVVCDDLVRTSTTIKTFHCEAGAGAFERTSSTPTAIQHGGQNHADPAKTQPGVRKAFTNDLRAAVPYRGSRATRTEEPASRRDLTAAIEGWGQANGPNDDFNPGGHGTEQVILLRGQHQKACRRFYVGRQGDVGLQHFTQGRLLCPGDRWAVTQHSQNGIVIFSFRRSSPQRGFRAPDNVGHPPPRKEGARPKPHVRVLKLEGR